MKCLSIRKHNLSDIFLLAWKCTSVSLIASCESKNGTYMRTNEIQRACLFKNFSTDTNRHSNQLSCKSISDIRKQWLTRFDANEVPESELSIRYIIEHVLGISKPYQYELGQSLKVTEDEENKIRTLSECRLARMPIQYIIKEWDFRELRLSMCPPVFIPRPETEELVDLIVAAAPPDSVFLEVGCGSGAISLSLLKALPHAQVVAVDQSKMACLLTINNSKLNGLTSNLQVIHSKLQEDGTFDKPVPLGRVDVLVSNPPYVPTAQMFDLQPEIKLYEDLRALEAGRDGLRVVKSLLLLAQTVLKPGALVFMEVDSTHPPLIDKWLSTHPEIGVKLVKTHRDYCEKDRFVEFVKL